MHTSTLIPGIERLARHPARWLNAGESVGLLAHPASVTSTGTPSAIALRDAGIRVAALFGPEHGYYGTATAGEPVRVERHPTWKIPVYSLYGATRVPTSAMMKKIHTIIVDLQDIGARPYTYGATLLNVMRAAAASGKRVIVTDRPIPLPHLPDGPLTDPAFESFVAAYPAPMLHAMTPGELARWLQPALEIPVELTVIPLTPHRCRRWQYPGGLPWIPPSQGILSWESAICYTATVFSEALPAVDIGRGTTLPFRIVGAPWLNADHLINRLTGIHLPGVRFSPYRYRAARDPVKDLTLDGIRIQVTNPAVFRPVTLSIHLLHELEQQAGEKRMWNTPGTRPEFFDKLYATDRVRLQLRASSSPRDIVRAWRHDLRPFTAARTRALLYSRA